VTAPLLLLRGALAPALVEEVRALLAPSAFRESTAELRSAATHFCIPEPSELVQRAAELVAGALEQSAPFKAATFASAMMTPRFQRYEVGVGYADHTDPVFLEGPPAMRRDIALTLALSEPGSYDGGDLVFDLGGATQRWRGEAGDCILYAPDLVHRVEPVTRGIRLVAVSWVESMVRGFDRRHILAEVANLIEALETGAAPEPHVEALQYGYANLLRLWM
jgi:PKHD-type hydroxylase